jgi:queuosine precursor transporter
VKPFISNKAYRLFLVLGGFFIANALTAEFIGVKIFSVERTLGLQPVQLNFFGNTGLSFNMSAGVILWPFVFVMTDLINEYYGRRGVRFLSFLAAIMIAYAFIMIYLTTLTTPADFWPASHILPQWPAEQQAAMRQKVGDYSAAFNLVFGQGMWIIVGSLVAFLIGQLVDVIVFHKIKDFTGDGKFLYRATGSTLVSQFIDSFVVLFIAFYIGAGWKLSTVLAIGLVNYLYKLSMVFLMVPLLVIIHRWIDRYLGKEMADQLKSEARQK